MSARRRRLMSLEAAEEELRFCDSYTRLSRILDLPMALDDRLKLLGEKWTVCDNIGWYVVRLARVLPTVGPVWELMYSRDAGEAAANRAAYEALPDPVTIYRGADRGVNDIGASWSLDRDVAARFPFLTRYRATVPILITATVPRSTILAVRMDRQEAEVIVHPAGVPVPTWTVDDLR